MSFTRPQQGLFRPMVAKAWQAHCKCCALDPRNRAAQDAWYRSELLESLGRDSTKDANPARDFETVMAHFETFIFGELYWNLRIMQGDTRRILHAIQTTCDQYQCDDAYARAVAVRVLKWEGYLTKLSDITAYADLSKLRIALIKQGRRAQKRAEQAAADPAEATPRAPLIGEGLRAIDPITGATEASFESEGIRERREAAEENTRELRKLARQQFAQDKLERATTARAAKTATHATVEDDNCPF